CQLLISRLQRIFAWTAGSLLLIAFNSLVWSVTMPLRRRSRRVFLFFLVTVLLLSWLVPVGDRRSDTPAGAVSLDYTYGLVSWEFENFFDKWGHRLWTALPWTPTSEADRRSALDRYVVLVDELRVAKDLLASVTSANVHDRDEVSDAHAAVDRLIAERDSLRDGIEEFLEQAVADAIRSDAVGLVNSFVWPPVDFRIDSPPKLLVISPRDVIRRDEDVLIDPDISVEDVTRIENELAELEDVSAIVLQTGGLASYPNVIPTTGLKRLLDVAAHEWLHTYLIFNPLGRAYFAGGDIRSMNETLADIFGREVGLRVYAEITGEPFVAPVRPETTLPRIVASESPDDNDTPEEIEDPEAFDFNRFMAETRNRTDELLEEGSIDAAEAYMESRRVELLEHGHSIRKINQAYFAFHGTYAESPTSTSPIARYLWDLREQVDTVGELVKLLRPLGSYEEFEQLLVERGIELEESE
ncbi:MAG: hypothetical protein O6922_02635, partial [Chloroflexi bacterium]|nr:hypothetical protein [Chloroflexota bacterium]